MIGSKKNKVYLNGKPYFFFAASGPTDFTLICLILHFLSANTAPSVFFLGKRLIESLLESKKWPKSIPKITDKGTAQLVAGALVQSAFFHRSEKVDGKKGFLKVHKQNIAL